MSPEIIRRIDYWAGVPVCFLLSLISGKRKKASEPKKIVFLKFIEQGATVLAYDAIKRAESMVGRENLYFCVFAQNRPILDILNIIPEKNILVLNEKSMFSFLWSALKALNRLRSEKVDTSVDMEFFSRASAIFSFLSGASARVGLHRFNSEQPYRGNLMTHRIQYNPYLHVSVYYRQLVEATRLDPGKTPMLKQAMPVSPLPLPSLQPDQHEIEKVKSIINAERPGVFSSNGKNFKLIILNPNAGDLLPIRKWDSKKFIELGKKIVEKNDTLILISGAPSERKAAEDICRSISTERAISLAGKTTLKELLVLYTLADVLITNDSGPGHFSALTQIKTVILFGPETPSLFGPLSPNAKVIWKALPCSPCVNVLNHRFSPCNDNQCMKQISVEDVMQEVAPLLN